MTITGVAGAIRHQQPTRAPVPLLYRPHAQSGGVYWVAVRTTGQPQSLAAVARQAVREMDKKVPVLRMRTMQQVVAESMDGPRMLASVISAFAAFALLLAATGIYGVIAYSVIQRRHELGVRIALGASRSCVLGLVVRQAVFLAVAGTLAGLPLAFLAGRALSAQLSWVRSWDVTIYFGTAVLLLITAALAGFLPARRASRLDPGEILRAE
jgi:putative ABC transport system permease protein